MDKKPGAGGGKPGSGGSPPKAQPVNTDPGTKTATTEDIGLVGAETMPKPVAARPAEVQIKPASVAAGKLAADKSSFTSGAPWENTSPDCLIICCSDHRFENQNRELAHALGFKHPHIVQIPSGPTVTIPLVSAFGFMGKAVDKIIESVVEMKHVENIVLIGHRDCGAYRAAKHPVIGTAMKLVQGKPVADLQKEHLAKAARRMQLTLRDVRVVAYFAETVEEPGTEYGQTVKKVRFDGVKIK